MINRARARRAPPSIVPIENRTPPIENGSRTHPSTMRPLKLAAVIFPALLVTVTGFLIYRSRVQIIQQEKPLCDDRQRSKYENLNIFSPATETNNPLGTIYSSIENILKKQSALNTKNSLSRNDFDTVVTLSLLLPPIKNISRMLTPTHEMFRNYIAPAGLPIIFTDMLVGTSMDNWSWDYVKENWGNTVFRNTRQGNYSTRVTKLGKHKIHRVSVRLSDFIDVVTGKRKPNENEKGLYITKQKVLPTEDLENVFYYPPFYFGRQRCFLEPTGW